MTKSTNRTDRSLERATKYAKRKRIEILIFFIAAVLLVISPLIPGWIDNPGINESVLYLQWLLFGVILALGLKMWQYARPMTHPDRTDPLGR